MRRRLILLAFVLTVSIATIYAALWYSGVFEERDCTARGGTWVAVRKACSVD